MIPSLLTRLFGLIVRDDREAGPCDDREAPPLADREAVRSVEAAGAAFFL